MAESALDGRLVAVGAVVRRLREEAGESQVSAAAALEMDRGFFRGIESGQRNFSLERLFAIADHYGVDPRTLLEPSG